MLPAIDLSGCGTTAFHVRPPFARYGLKTGPYRNSDTGTPTPRIVGRARSSDRAIERY